MSSTFVEKKIKLFGGFELSPLELLALLIVGGRFYYLMGYVGHLKPIAPIPLLFIKDIVTVLVIGSFFVAPKVNAPKSLRILMFIWFSGFVGIASIHFFAKSFSDWGQHYIRNIVLVLATAPALYRWAGSSKLFSFSRFLFWGCWINIVAALLQEIFIPETMLGLSRPLGLVGDPISLTALVLMFFAVIIAEPISKYKLIIYSLICGYVLNMAASISACLSAAVAAIPVIFLLCKYLEKIERKKLFIKLTMCFTFLLVGLSIPHNQRYDNLTERIKVLYNSYLQKRAPQSAADDLLYDSLKNGRAQSFEITKQSISSEKISRDQLALWIGGYKDSMYRRVDSTPAVLILNWGMVDCLIFYFTFAIIIYCWFRKFIFTKNMSIDSSNLKVNALTFFCLLEILLLGFLNSILYRSPLNFILVLVTTQIVYVLMKNEKNQITQSD